MCTDAVSPSQNGVLVGYVELVKHKDNFRFFLHNR